jgi:PadR family transcriptional regulator PadR
MSLEVNKKMMRQSRMQKAVENRVVKGLLDIIVLRIVNSQPTHGYEIIQRIRRGFGIYVGPSTIYPLLNALEEEGYVKGEWNMDTERPRKLYAITAAGQALLTLSEKNLNFVCSRIDAIANVEANEQCLRKT